MQPQAKRKIKEGFLITLEKEGKMRLAPRIYHHPKLKLEPEAVQQLKNASALPGVMDVFATPDIHVGYGVPIGCVIAATDIVCPAAVGYDVNCGMRLLKSPLKAKDVDTVRLANEIAKRIPLGEGKENFHLEKRLFKQLIAEGVPSLSRIEIPQFSRSLRNDISLAEDLDYIEDRGSLPGKPECVSERALDRGRKQLATLGGGNHFIELQVVDKVFDSRIAQEFGLFEGQFVIMLHSGSRGLGHQIGQDYMDLGRRIASKDGRFIPNKELPYFFLHEKHAKDYLGAMNAAANFAFINRHLMGALVKDSFLSLYPDARLVTLYDLAHNIAKFEQHKGRRVLVHRKGAARAFSARRMKGTPFERVGQPVLVPGSMGTASYVMVGTEANEDTFATINHGAGRQMSRIAASGRTRRGKPIRGRESLITDEEFWSSMKGIHIIAENIKTVKEEAPQAYKDIDLITEAILEAGLAKTVARLKPLAVLKG